MKTERPYHIYFLIALGLGLGAVAFTGCSTLRSPYDSDYADDRQECASESTDLFYEANKRELAKKINTCNARERGRAPAEAAERICHQEMTEHFIQSKEIHAMIEGCLRNKGWDIK